MVMDYRLLCQVERLWTRVEQLGTGGQHGRQGTHRRVSFRTRRYGQ